MTEIVELDNHFEMTVEQTFGRAQREDLEKVIVIGRLKSGGLIMTYSDMEDREVFWALSKAKQAVFDD